MKQLNINKINNSLTLNSLEKDKQCQILTESYGEVTSVCLNKSEIKRIINWLQRFNVLNEKEC